MCLPDQELLYNVIHCRLAIMADLSDNSIISSIIPHDKTSKYNMHINLVIYLFYVSKQPVKMVWPSW